MATKKRTCKLWYCKRPFYCKGVCMKHYRRTNRHGGPEIVSNEDLNVVLAFINYELDPFLEMVISVVDHPLVLAHAKGLYEKIREQADD